MNPDLARIPTDKGLIILEDNFTQKVIAFKWKAQYFIHRIVVSRRIPAFLHLNKLPLNVFINQGEMIRGKFRRPIEDVLFDSRARKRKLYNNEMINALFKRHCQNKANFSKEISRLVVMELFFQNFLD